MTVAGSTSPLSAICPRPMKSWGRRCQRGFTLIELLVVLVILGLLAALAGPRVVNYLSGAKTDSARLQIENLKSVLDLYRIDTGSYPTTQQGLQALVRNPGNVPGWRQGYLDSQSVPVDPWGHPYVYRSPSDRGPYELSSLGSDHAPGGNGEAADVTSWGR
jgi:general secretion pathway protein G